MNSNEIADFFSRHPLTRGAFKGVFNAGDTPKLENGLYVFNTLPRNAPPERMGHWVCFVVGDRVTYFDSTGLPEIELSFDRDVIRNEKIMQSMFTLNCGLYVLYFGLEMMRGKSLKSFQKQFSSEDLIKNDIFILSKMRLEYEINNF
jgi:hypothetical protein